MLLAKLARRRAWKLARRMVRKQVTRRGGKLARTVLRRSTARVVRLSAVAASKSPLRYMDSGERAIVRLFTLAEQLRQG